MIEGRYRILDQLGEGGMGTVYRAEHLKLGRKVALKVLLTEHGPNPTVRARFEREAKALAALSHPNVITVTDFGVSDELPYIVMELLEGRTLKDRLEEGPLASEEAFRIARELLRGLSYAHGEGVAHRDLKPANVFLQSLPDGLEHVKILDFGLAKFAHDTGEGAPLTKLGSVLGTPAYMAPEQASGESSDARSDVYASGIVILEMLAGRRPFDGEHTDVLRQQLLSPLPSVATLCPWREGSPALEAFLSRATAKERDARFQSASEMLAALDALPQPAVREKAAPARRAAVDVLGTAATVPGTVEAAQVRSARSARGSVPGKRSGGGAFAAVLGAGALVVLALGALLVGIVVWMSAGDDGESASSASGESADLETDPETDTEADPATDTEAVAASPTATPRPRPTVTPPAGTPTTPTPTADTPDNPWAGPTPRLLADVKRAVDANRRVSGRTDGRLISYARDHRDDPRPHILLGRIYLARGWRPDAMERFEVAWRTNTSAAGDPEMLEALVSLASHARTSSRAATLLRDAFGPRALVAVDEALASGELDDESANRLARVRGRLM